MFKVYINDGEQEMPDDDIFYIIGQNGIFLRKKLGRIDAIIPVDKISTLGNVAADASYDLPKIPRHQFAKIVDFFKEIHAQHSSEAIVLVHFNEETEHYKIQCPHQKITGGSVQYLRNIIYEGYDNICTIHSHSSMSAFHSSTDDHDEKDVDGLHITVGRVDWDDGQFELSCSIVFNGTRFIVDPMDYIDGLENIEHIRPKPVNTYSHWASHFNLPGWLNKAPAVKEDKEDKKETIKTTPGYIVNVPKSRRVYDKRWLDFVDVISLRRKIAHYQGHYSGISHFPNMHEKNQEIINRQFPNSIGEFGLENDDSSEYNPCKNCMFSEYKLLQEVEEIDDVDDELEGLEDLEPGTNYNFRLDSKKAHENLIKKGGDI